ncbi:hypothetical protein ACF049_07745 [Cellulosimicrobium funkei]|uniref:hypothetical protein n=1 Tax=Cellulosimicrobium funkei TaxID=264251 RepID=UPI0036FCEC81
MPDQTPTHLAMLLDRSGSMQSIKQATEQGFDLFLAEQREAPGRCTVTLAQFDYELPWTVIASRSGQLNKVTFRAGERVPGFYCYTTAVQAAAGPLGGAAAAR